MVIIYFRFSNHFTWNIHVCVGFPGNVIGIIIDSRANKDNLPIATYGSVGENTDSNASYLHEKHCRTHSFTEYPPAQHGLCKTKMKKFQTV